MGLSGGSGSGKSTLARALVAAMPEQLSVIEYDWYYHCLAHVPLEERERCDFDAPEALDTAQLLADLTRLQAGETVAVPQYDFSTHCRKADSLSLSPKDILLVEGIHALTDARLRAIYDWSMYLDVPVSVRLERRIARDCSERGRSREAVVAQFEGQTAVHHGRYVAPSGAEADVVYDRVDDGVVASVVERLRGMLVGG